MKKLYTFAFASAMVLSASAVRPVTASNLAKIPKAHDVELNAEILEKASLKSKFPAAHKAASRAAGTIDDFEGAFEWLYFNLQQDADKDGYADEVSEPVNFVIEDAATGKVKVELFDGFYFNGTIDLDNNTMTIPNMQLVGEDEDGDVYFYLKEASDNPFLGYDNGASDAESTVGTIAGTTITFSDDYIWALGDPDNEEVGWYFLAIGNEFMKGIEWEVIGKGEFLENIMYYALTEQNNTRSFMTDVAICEDLPNYFRVTNPLKASYAVAGINATSPDLIFDATDPDNVLVGLTDSGLSSSSLGAFYYMNEGYAAGEDETIEPELACTLKRAGNQYTITCPPQSMLLYTTLTQQVFWCSTSGSTILSFKYQAAGMDQIVVNEDEPVEYYNLQGIRVANPSNGVYIRRQGNEATKVRF